jgi:thioredoxin 1
VRASEGGAETQTKTREAQLQEMEAMRSALHDRLKAHETELKSQPVNPAVLTSSGDEPGADGITPLGMEDFWSTLKGLPADTLAIVDCYTTNCGPCKLIYPKVVELAAEYESGKAKFYKFLCSKQNREIGVSLGIKVAPTFILFKGGVEVARMTGAKIDQLKDLVKTNVA